MTALSKLRVLDLSDSIAGAFCTKLMAGFGADVVKLEQPKQGDSLRGKGPFFDEKAGIERSIPFHWLNTAKRSLALDWRSPRGVEIVKQLSTHFDVVVETGKPGALANIGLGEPVLRAKQPKVVLTSITAFGQSGPYKDYEAEEITSYAMSGGMYATGHPEREPLAPGPSITQLTAGMKAYIATLMAVFRALRSGEGDWIDVSTQEAALDNIEIAMAEYLHLGKVAKRGNDEHALVPWRIFPCKDGHAAIIGGPIRHWLSAAEMFEEPELTDETHDHMAKRIAHRDRIRELMAPWLMKTDKKTIYHEGQSRKLALSYLATLTDAVESPQLAAREFFRKTQHPEVGTYDLAGAPFIPEKTPWHHGRAPLLGEHSDELLYQTLGLSEADVQTLRREGVVG